MSDAVAPWTCPFCPLACDTFGVAPDGDALALVGSDCARARAGLAGFGAQPSDATPLLYGAPCDEASAVAAAARLLGASRQPLFGGLATDVAGARALHRLACATGAISDAAAGAALMHALRALQDRGGYATTLAELRTRADLVVCLGALPTERHPEFLRRAGLAPDDARLVVVGADADLHAAAAGLAAAVATGRSGRADLQDAADRLRAARYGVIVYETARLPAHGALVVEMLQRAVATLNRSTRAAALALGGGDGAATVNQVYGWLSGLPLRQRAGARGVEHDPVVFDAGRLLADGAVDLLLWVSTFGPQPAAPPTRVPRIVLGHPGQAAAGADVYIPVATPGIGSDGHLFRSDGIVLLPLHAVRAERLPALADVVGRIAAALRLQAAA